MKISRYKIVPPSRRVRRLEQERVGKLAVVCVRYGREVTPQTLGSAARLLDKYECRLFRVAEPDCLFVCFSQITHADWQRRARTFYEQAINMFEPDLAGVGHAEGDEILYPDEYRRDPHEFPDGPVCHAAYKRSYGDAFEQ